MRLKSITTVHAVSLVGLATSQAFDVEHTPHKGLELERSGDSVIARKGELCDLVPLANVKKYSPLEMPRKQGRPRK